MLNAAAKSRMTLPLRYMWTCLYILCGVYQVINPSGVDPEYLTREASYLLWIGIW